MLDRSLDAALADHCREMFGGRLTAAALTGSQLRGWATEFSDFDLIALLDEHGSNEEPGQNYIGGLFRGALTEALVIDQVELDRIVGLSDRSEYNSIPMEDILALEKVLSARPILGEDVWAERVARVDQSAYRERLAQRQRRFATNTFDDVRGAWCQGDLGVAVDTVRALLRNEVEALLCASGDTNGRSKWMSLRVAECTALPSDFRDRFRRIHFAFDLDVEDAMGPWIEDAFAFHVECQRLFFHLTQGFATRPDRWENGVELRPVLPLFVARLRDSWVAKSPAGAVSIPRGAAEALLLVDRPISFEAIAGVGEVTQADVDDLLTAGLLKRAQL